MGTCAAAFRVLSMHRQRTADGGTGFPG